MMIKIAKLYISILFSMTLTFIKGHSCIKNIKQNFDVDFRANIGIDLAEVQYVAITCWFVEAHA